MHNSLMNKILLLTLLFMPSLVAKVTSTQKLLDTKTTQLALTINSEKQDYIDKQSIQFSVDHPDIEISSWQSDNEIIKQYDPTSQEIKKVFATPVTITLTITKKIDQPITNAHLHFFYYALNAKKIFEEIIALEFLIPKSPVNLENANKSTSIIQERPIEKMLQEPIKKNSHDTNHISWSAYLSNLLKSTDSLPIRLLLVLLLGLLMSLTPCIYPMIPITVGILQAQGSKSFGRNCLLSLSYTMGIATTFALLGLTAAFTGQIFGSLMANKYFILAVVAVLAYLGFSMLGFYDMYTPKFMRSTISTGGGSCISAFLFGAASGTVASPCLSPGLILLLSIVTALGSAFLGFLLLFFFGIGLSIPLLLIGTFSTSLSMLPQAGMWMVEVKKIFGFLLFGMCFYFLGMIMPWYVVLWLISVSMLLAGIFYFSSISPHDSKPWHTTKNLLGFLLTASSLLMMFQSFQATYAQEEPSLQAILWHADYDHATKLAQEQHKLLFIDVNAAFCAICKEIDHKIFDNPAVTIALESYVPVRIDLDNSPTEIVDRIKQEFKIIGVPTILVVNPKTQQCLARWEGELLDTPVEEFAYILNNHAAAMAATKNVHTAK